MCGIVGMVGFDAPLERAREIVSAMNSRIAHRGPDGEGLVAHPDATLAMKRLAIVDVAHGAQPMATEDESIVLVYNGEVYNAPALRRELERDGVRFRTRSDTEVILRLYERDPEGVERHLVGMWAFAVHDRRRRRVVLSRDRFGIKPLFVADTGRALAFASELRCFDPALPGFADLFAVDADAAHAMLAWSFVPESSTIYRGVKRLAPGSRMTIDLDRATRRTEAYWTLTPLVEATRVRSLDEACEGTEHVLRRAVKEHLESDVPIATFLSGGIDSSLVTAYADDAAPGTIKGYSIAFREAAFDESPFARATAEKIGVPLVVGELDEQTARERLADALLAYDEPFGDSSSLATYLLSKQVARDYKVALGGDGGDEIFAGYKKYLLVRPRDALASLPRVRDALGRALRTLPSASDSPVRVRRLLTRIENVSTSLRGSDAQAYAEFTTVASLARTAPLMAVSTSPERFLDATRARFEAAVGTQLQRSLTADLGSTLTNDMLVKVDRASMACHLEARVPFLDHRVAEYGVGLPAEYTLGPVGKRWVGKRVLRELHRRRFGAELANRDKHGFGIPVQSWLRGPLATACERLFEAPRLERYGLLSARALAGGRFRAWLEEKPAVVWHAFALAAWCEATLGDGPDVVRELLGPRRVR